MLKAFDLFKQKLQKNQGLLRAITSPLELA
jgi:hypothetical protein